MKKSEVEKVADNELIVELANTNAMYSVNYNNNGGVKQLAIKLTWLTNEMVRRGLITEEQQHHLLYD